VVEKPLSPIMIGRPVTASVAVLYSREIAMEHLITAPWSGGVPALRLGHSVVAQTTATSPARLESPVRGYRSGSGRDPAAPMAVRTLVARADAVAGDVIVNALLQQATTAPAAS
jgi:hypothetical protein